MSEMMNGRWICPRCGYDANTGNFCGKCGAPKPLQTYSPMPAPGSYANVPQPAVQAAPKSKKEFTAEDRKKANRLCIISLILAIVGPVFSIGIAFIMQYVILSYSAEELLTMLMRLVGPGAIIAGAALMIICRVKYPKSKFGLFLMILYCLYVALGVIMLLALISDCISTCNSMRGTPACG